MIISKLISGAQTGADRGGLDAAIELGIPYGGFIPKGRRAEDGQVPACYVGLEETEANNYLARTRLNAEYSTATLIFTHGPLTGGSAKTEQFCRKLDRLCLHIDLTANTMPPLKVVNWLHFVAKTTGEQNLILNVAGQRESKAPGLQAEVKAFLIEIVTMLKE